MVEMNGYTASTEGPMTFSWADRFPRNVAEVRLVFESGRTYAADAVDGFVAFELAGPEPDELATVLQYDDRGRLVGGPRLAPGDADLPVGQRSLVPDQPLDTVVVNDDL
ncbi:hypothetical protein [Nocardioides sp. TF02-7]|uniref:hypothetical protein n=1 Tax=Nocardioides sp. TF02-7 TaxID=2917724 RepID=UPI001F061F37|nr:hypothetical protein [Nocardioides sp. TF02-7]UMG91008.1 hypothetical protein MF408_12260 [Nocardioides sp. TF02-7]